MLSETGQTETDQYCTVPHVESGKKKIQRDLTGGFFLFDMIKRDPSCITSFQIPSFGPPGGAGGRSQITALGRPPGGGVWDLRPGHFCLTQTGVPAPLSFICTMMEAGIRYQLHPVSQGPGGSYPPRRTGMHRWPRVNLLSTGQLLLSLSLERP